ncbi:MAG: bifunctional UDP-N-acetylmuramoyl-tripeptide:D-alanyl-D-alanine ligase/alanine racemase [Bacteroidia bacterium]|nr:bifunctional UDP-N-acetylmuramoyl-tripeptide:D-alanyl-D-alanine ligase/alanine racemase [Bacteroidia bacterium]
MQYSLHKIAEIVDGNLVGNKDQIIEQVLIDSRKKAEVLGTLFCAISGKQNNGHDYIQQLIDDGYQSFLVEYVPETIPTDKANFIVVSDVLEALQVWAKAHRSKHNLELVAITGSNGKTIVKEWCYQLLYREINVVRNPRSYNSQVGVPISLLNIQPGHELGIFEAGISEVGEMHSLEKMLSPTIGLFTNIGDAHAAGFTNESEKIYEKLVLFSGCKALIYRSEDNLLTDIIERFTQEHCITPYSWSENQKAYLTITNKVIEGGQCNITANCEGKKLKVVLPFTDDTSIENAMHAWLLSLVLKVDQNRVSKALRNLQPIEMRLNQKAGINHCSIISDYYNSDFRSIEIALDWAERRQSHEKKTIILSDVEQSNLSDRDLYTDINQLLKRYQYQKLIGIGKRITEYAFLFDLPQLAFYETTEAFLESDQLTTFNDESILLKGARSFAFEHIEKSLQQKVHNTVLEVNLNALQNNLNYYKSLVSSDTRIMVMVKAFSYGSGGDEIAHFLQFNQVDYLGVAYADEGVALRKNGIHLPIMVMNSDEDSFDTMLDYNLEPELYSFRSLKLFANAVNRKAVAHARAHLEVNTGMNRLGFNPSEVDEVIAELKNNPDIEIQSIFSHFASVDDPSQDVFSKRQIQLLNAFYDRFSHEMAYHPLKHIGNSAGALRFKEAQFDMIRLGISLYGFSPANDSSRHIETISTLKSFISQIRTVEAHEGVSYGNGDKHDKPRKIAVVAIGYADGLNRLLSNGNGYFLINGDEARIVGSVCMDMTMCDVTGINCKEGDEVIVFGKKPSITEIADRTGTIPYEVLTSVSERVKRVYSEE